MTAEPLPGEVCAIPVGELLCSDDYSIPLYQRNYTWGEEQIHRLVYDILDEAEQDDPKQYFLGNLVVAPPAQSHDPFDVIDGQQRLTTLYILLAKLRAVLDDGPDRIGELRPLTYEARDKATRALRGLAGRTAVPTAESQDAEDSGILRAVNIVEQLLNDQAIGKRLLAPHVIDYLLDRVLIIRMPIDRRTDLNRYFEIMNTRGAQLSPVDIVKARLLRHVPNPDDRALFNLVWTACSDMEHYVAMTVTSGNTELRKEVFGENWEDVPTADFSRLREQLVSGRRQHGHPNGDAVIQNGSTAMTFGEALDTYSRTGSEEASGEPEADERFTSQISFPTFLLHVLAVRRSATADNSDRQLDDKQLVDRFASWIDSLDATQRTDWVRTFTTDLLRIRFLFDRYILKRDATLTTGHESTTDEEPGSWSLYRLTRGKSRKGKNVHFAPRYQATFSDNGSGSNAGSLHRRILLLQSALRITYTSPRTMHWITVTLRYVTERSDYGHEVQADELLDSLESYALASLEAALQPSSDDAELGPDGLPLGFAIPRIVFTYLDYLLVQHLNRWDFTFSYRTSIEHFSPRAEDAEHASAAYHVRDRRLLDWLGNLALVTVSANSKFSNYLPAEKANNEAARRQSLKLDLMAKRANSGSWNDDDIKAHHHEMVELLRRALADRPRRTSCSGESQPRG